MHGLKGGRMKIKKLSEPRLVYGVGITDAGYVVQEFETVRCVNGKRKLELAYELAAIQTDERVAKALIDRYTNYNIGATT